MAIPTTTDTRLLDVAIDHFGRFGLNGASTRAIAKDAETPMSSITYHFGGKEGLYLAAARRISALMAAKLAPAVTEIDFAIADGGAAAGRKALQATYAHMLRVIAGPDAAPLAQFIMREQADPTEAFSIIFEEMMAPLLTRVVALLKIVSGGKLDEREGRLRAITLFGQALVFRVARQTAIRGMGWTDIGARELAAIEQVLFTHLSAVLDQLAARGRA